MNSRIISFLETNQILYETNVDLKKKTWIHRGGVADIFITPSNSDELETLVSFLYTNDIKFLLIGHTSNIYIFNECNLPVVVSTIKCRSFKLDRENIYCEAGVGVIYLSKQMIKCGVCGFEYLTGLPGTVGAALVNNSSCKSNSISILLRSARVILKDGSIKVFTPEDFKFEFRNSAFKKGDIEGTIISVILKAELGDFEEMRMISIENDQERERLLEGHANNLGCTVNRCFVNGKMPLYLRVILSLHHIYSKIVRKSEPVLLEQKKKILCHVTGYKSIVPYVSSKNPIIFRWLDTGADDAFPLYLEFMKKVYKTDKVEIEIIR